MVVLASPPADASAPSSPYYPRSGGTWEQDESREICPPVSKLHTAASLATNLPSTHSPSHPTSPSPGESIPSQSPHGPPCGPLGGPSLPPRPSHDASYPMAGTGHHSSGPGLSLNPFSPSLADIANSFYGSLLNAATSKPSEVLVRMSDALFFFLDVGCPFFRHSKHIEPAKYGWFLRVTGSDADTAQVIEEVGLQSLYDMAAIPYQVVTIRGVRVPILDRRGFLHMLTFKVRAQPETMYKDFEKYLSEFALADPATGCPFPAPIPRSAFPNAASPDAAALLSRWLAGIAQAAGQRRAHGTSVRSTAGAGAPGFGAAGLGAAGLLGAAGVGAAAFGAYAALAGKTAHALASAFGASDGDSGGAGIFSGVDGGGDIAQAQWAQDQLGAIG